jgi:hypothetical protein
LAISYGRVSRVLPWLCNGNPTSSVHATNVVWTEIDVGYSVPVRNR